MSLPNPLESILSVVVSSIHPLSLLGKGGRGVRYV
jgi:hypothetical protein